MNSSDDELPDIPYESYEVGDAASSSGSSEIEKGKYVIAYIMSLAKYLC